MLASAQSVLDVQNSGCLNKTRGGDSQEEVQTIVLTKEGSTLSVQLLNYISNCCAEDFNVTSSINRCSDCESDSGNSYVTISVIPVGEECDCTCPFNLSFAIRDLESNSIYLNCWWYHGYIELKEGEPMVMAFINDLYYHLLPSINEAEVIKCPNDYTGNLEIPEKVVYNGTEHRVTSIKENAFFGCSNLTSVTIPNSVTSIGGFAFYSCSGLTSIDIPNSVTNIEEATFANCTGLTSFNIPNSVTNIGVSAFSGCKGLTSVIIPNSVTSIGGFAFYSCSGLTSIDIPNSVTNIKEGAFSDCSSLATFTIPNSVSIIENETFNYCSSMTSITIPNSITSIGHRAFNNCSSLTTIAIPNAVTSIGYESFYGCSSLTSVTIPNSVTSIGQNAFRFCKGLTSITIPNSVISIGQGAIADCTSLTSITIPDYLTDIEVAVFSGCENLTTVVIPSTVTSVRKWAFRDCPKLKNIYCWPENAPSTEVDVFQNVNIKKVTLHVPAASVSAYQAIEPWKNFKQIVALPAQDDYRPFIEDGKVWKVGSTVALSDSIVKMVEYYYFDGDTIIDGKTCKQMMCQRFVSPNHPDYADIMRYPLSWYVGAWYEEDKKVYKYNAASKQFWMAYDFSLNANDTLQFDPYSYISYVIGPKQTGGLEGFKGVYREIMWLVNGGPNYYCTTWMEGVGSIDAPTVNIHYGKEGIAQYLMSCVVGDEVIYYNDKFEDGATPAGARKNRFDFTHTIKIQPKTRKRSEGMMESPYGEYNDLQLGINLDPLDDDYLVRITDETDEVVYEKAVNAGNIVGLSIDISAYAKGRYTVTIENSQEAFTGEFETQTTGIVEILKDKDAVRTAIYNLQGQRLTSPQKGLNIVNGQKVYVK